MQFKRFVFALLAILALGMQQQAFAKQKAEKENKHSSSDHHHKSKSVRSPWIEYKNGVNVFKFNVFNLDPVHVDQKKLKKICKAVEKATCKYFQPSYGTRADIRVYPASESLNPDLFNGDRIPMYVLDSMVFDEFGFIGSHQQQLPVGYPSYYQNFEEGSFNMTELFGIPVPNNFPDFTPTADIGSGTVFRLLQTDFYQGNPYAYHGLDHFYDLLSFVISHEVFETLGDDTGQNWAPVDNTIPAAQEWKFRQLGPDGNPAPGTYTIDSNGYVILPPFNDFFPDGFMGIIIQEAGDAVSVGSAAKLQTFRVDGVAMTNFPLTTFWKPWNVSSDIKYDQLGFVKLPIQPFAGSHAGVMLTDLGNGFLGPSVQGQFVITNQGPMTSYQRAHAVQQTNPLFDPALNNFPPNTTYVTYLGPISNI